MNTVQIKTVANSLAQYHPDKAMALLEAIAQQDKKLAEAFVKSVMLVYPEIVSEVSP